MNWCGPMKLRTVKLKAEDEEANTEQILVIFFIGRNMFHHIFHEEAI